MNRNRDTLKRIDNIDSVSNKDINFFCKQVYKKEAGIYQLLYDKNF
jgi:hypothetical protein